MNYPAGFKPEAVFGRRRYVKEGRVPASAAVGARCRGMRRASLRRSAAETEARWPLANAKSLPHRMAKAEKLDAKRKEAAGGKA